MDQRRWGSWNASDHSWSSWNADYENRHNGIDEAECGNARRTGSVHAISRGAQDSTEGAQECVTAESIQEVPKSQTEVETSHMNLDQWFMAIRELAATHARQLIAGEITPDQATREEEEMVLRARLDLSDEDGKEMLNRMLSSHQEVADELARRGRPIPGNDSTLPQ